MTTTLIFDPLYSVYTPPSRGRHSIDASRRRVFHQTNYGVLSETVWLDNGYRNAVVLEGGFKSALEYARAAVRTGRAP